MDLARPIRTALARLKAVLAFSLAAAFLALPALASAEPLRGSGWGLPHDASVDGHRIDWLINITGVFVAILFVIMCIWMAIAAFKHGKDHQAEYDHGSTRHHVVTALVISGLIFLVVDGNLFYFSVKDLHEAFWNFSADERADVVRLEVNAHQWAWDARYEGPDGRFNTADDIVTLNDIRVPEGRPVIVQVASTDVIHSFSLPHFRQKMDAVPGVVNRLWFQAKETGQYEIVCQQHCGVAHYLMRGVLTVLPDAEYEAWASHASRIAELSHDPADAEAAWGWEWKKEM
jgi:cytochrome c oxidase subunit 2